MENIFREELNHIEMFKDVFKRNTSDRRKSLSNIASVISEKYLSGGLLVISSFLGNIFNFLYNAFLSRSKIITLEEFGLLSLIGSFLYISQVPLGAVMRTVTHKSAFLLGKYGFVVINFWSNIRQKLLFLSTGLTLIWLIFIPVLERIFKSTDIFPFLVFSPVWMIGMLIAVDSGFLNGNLHFKQAGILILVEAISKLIFAVFFVNIGLSKWVYISIPLSMTCASVLAWFYVVRIKVKKIIPHPSVLDFPMKFFWTSILRTFSILSFLGFDIILAKLFLTPKETGSYALLSLSGKMIYIIGGEISQFILPIVSKEEGAGRNSKKAFYKLIIVTTITCLISYLIFGLFGFKTAPLMWGEKSKTIIQFLPYYTLSMVFFTISSAVVSYHQAKKDLIVPILNFILAFIQITLLFLFHSTLEQFIWIILINSLFSITIICFFHFYYQSISNSISYLSSKISMLRIITK